MQRIVHNPTPLRTDSFGASTAASSPVPDPATFRVPVPGREDLLGWLCRLAPPGAPMVPLGGYVPDGLRLPLRPPHRELGVPLLAELANPPMPSGRDEQRRELGRRLPPHHFRKRPRRTPRAGVKRWHIYAAMMRDLRGASPQHLAEHFDFADVQTMAAEAGASRSARRYVAEGRRALAALGAWPWCLTPPEGKLDSQWYAHDRYAEALAMWHYRAAIEALEDVLASVAAGGGDRGLSLHTMEALEDARAVYERVYQRTRDSLAPTSV